MLHPADGLPRSEGSSRGSKGASGTGQLMGRTPLTQILRQSESETSSVAASQFFNPPLAAASGRK